jgi:crotonobetainyl-CoA:carnitine CoA-transferase CaiB-like acyl-CoA transferase
VVDWISAIGGSSYLEFLQVYEAAHYGAFATRDEHVITLGVTLEQRLWAELITALGRPDWSELDTTARTERRDELLAYLRGRIAELTSDELDVLLAGADTCWAWARVPGSPSRVSGGT